MKLQLILLLLLIILLPSVIACDDCDGYSPEVSYCSGNKACYCHRCDNPCGDSDVTCDNLDKYSTCQTCANGCDPGTKQCIVCQRNCDGKCNGETDGCGGTCTCASGQTCLSGHCCTTGQVWSDNQCCTPNCTDKCGGASDGCGGTCNACASGTCYNQRCYQGVSCNAAACTINVGAPYATYPRQYSTCTAAYCGAASIAGMKKGDGTCDNWDDYRFLCSGITNPGKWYACTNIPPADTKWDFGQGQPIFAADQQIVDNRCCFQSTQSWGYKSYCLHLDNWGIQTIDWCKSTSKCCSKASCIDKDGNCKEASNITDVGTAKNLYQNLNTGGNDNIAFCYDNYAWAGGNATWLDCDLFYNSRCNPNCVKWILDSQGWHCTGATWSAPNQICGLGEGVKAGELNVGEYKNVTSLGCCGDDSSENLICLAGKKQNNTNCRCCNSNSDIVMLDATKNLVCSEKPKEPLLVFVSSQVYNGNLGGLSGADAKCNALAKQAGLTGSFKAWFSDQSVDVKDRFTVKDKPYVLKNGKPVANDFADILSCSPSCLLNKINITEKGLAAPTTISSVWTGTASTGAKIGADGNSNCKSWTQSSNSYTGQVGSYAAINGEWTSKTKYQCNLQFSLYCFEDTPIQVDKCGDLNHDDVVNEIDLEILNTYVRSTETRIIQTWPADVNCDSQINDEDITLLNLNLTNVGRYPLRCCLPPSQSDMPCNVCILNTSRYYDEHALPPVNLFEPACIGNNVKEFAWENLSKQSQYCCGNDKTEFLKCDGSTCICCDHKDDKIVNGKCVGGTNCTDDKNCTDTCIDTKRLYEGKCANGYCIYAKAQMCLISCVNGSCAGPGAPCTDIKGCPSICNSTWRYYDGACNNNICIYSKENCTNGCANGECVIDPCAAINCSPKCIDTRTRQFCSNQSKCCLQGQCNYDQQETCTCGCLNGTCVEADSGREACTACGFVWTENECCGDDAQEFVKTNWDGSQKGCCKTADSCLVNQKGDKNITNPLAWFESKGPRCIASNQYILDYLCEQGVWTSRTQTVALQLLKKAKDTSADDYVVFCDSYKNTLNYYDYDIESTNLVNAKDILLDQTCQFGSIEFPCLNNFCVLTDSAGKLRAFGSSLNPGVDLTTLYSLLAYEGDCGNTLYSTDNQFHQCRGTGELWFNNQTASFVLGKEVRETSQGSIRLTLVNWVNSFKEWLISSFNSIVYSTYPSEKFLQNATQFNKIFMAKKGKRQILAKQENIVEKNVSREFLVAQYSNFDTDICSIANRLEPRSCFKDGSYYIRSSKAGTTNPLFERWLDLTAKIRIIP
ncbi:MAG: dockerin type I domain-containing protein [Candidatus Woesearchaeota archaeon]